MSFAEGVDESEGAKRRKKQSRDEERGTDEEGDGSVTARRAEREEQKQEQQRLKEAERMGRPRRIQIRRAKKRGEEFSVDLDKASNSP